MRSKQGLLFLFVSIVLLLNGVLAQTPNPLADSVRSEFLHAWNGYKQYAWGHDALKPLSKRPHDWYGQSLLLTPVDAFDTMVLMGLKKEAAEAKQLILDSLSFDRNIEVQTFEIVIRLLGGLISAYQLDGDPRFLSLAEDLGHRLLPIFDTPTGMPYRYVNLKTGALRDSINNPAEIGTLMLEFGTLSKLTGNPEYYRKSKLGIVQVFNHRSRVGLVGETINVVNGEWKRTSSHIGAYIDSYYEYLFKSWLLFGDADFKRMWDSSIDSVNKYLADTTYGGLWYGHAEMNSGKRSATRYGSLEAFMPALLALSGDVKRAAALQSSGEQMWNLYGIEPEELDYASMKVTAKEYYLRPEIIESAFYLYRSTGDEHYRKMGEGFFRSLVKYCRTEAGFAYLKDVVTKQQADGMESFFFAETMKYFYLLFAPKEAFDLNAIVLTTEAHPIRKTWKE
jgi:mannosidase alpha-like ER degradation enhancer 2